VVVLDLLLPDRSGLDLLATLKADHATRPLPVVVVSVVSDPVRSLSLGAAEHLAKPVEAAAVAAAVRRVAPAPPSRGPTVLVAGAEGGAAEGLRAALRREGFRTLLARDGRQALDVLGKGTPDAVVMELGLAEVSGLEVLEEMARDELARRVPVLLLSGDGGETELRRAMALGARRCMGAPVDPYEVAAEVRRQVAAPGEAPARRVTVTRG
jgi:CheY-like chemotaxis protein